LVTEGSRTVARVGIATLYRRFPDRVALTRAVALYVLVQVAAEARAAVAEERDAFQALRRYLHRALDLRIAAVMPVRDGQHHAHGPRHDDRHRPPARHPVPQRG
jgi:AcrR family transcriptional regulator